MVATAVTEKVPSLTDLFSMTDKRTVPSPGFVMEMFPNEEVTEIFAVVGVPTPPAVRTLNVTSFCWEEVVMPLWSVVKSTGFPAVNSSTAASRPSCPFCPFCPSLPFCPSCPSLPFCPSCPSLPSLPSMMPVQSIDPLILFPMTLPYV